MLNLSGYKKSFKKPEVLPKQIILKYITSSHKRMEDERALKDFIRGGGAVFLTLSASSILAFLYKLILARGLGPSQLGLFEMSFTILGLISTIGGLGLASGLVRFIPYYRLKSKEHLSGFLRAVIIIQLVTSIIASLLLVLFAEKITIFFGFPELFTKVLYIIAFALPFRKFCAIFAKTLLGFKKVMIAKIGKDIIKKVVLLIGALVILFFELDIFAIAIFIVLSNFLAFVYYLYFFIPLSQKIKTKKRKYEIKRWIKYSLPLVFAGLMGFFLKWTDNLVIGRMLDESDLGIYAVAFSVAMFLFMGSRIFSGIFLPIMTEYYEKDKKHFEKIFITIRNWTMLFSFALGSIFILYANNILLFLYGSEFTDGASSLQVLAAFFIIANYFYFSSKLIHLEEQTQKILYGDILTLIINVSVTIYLVSQIGILGAAIGAGLSYFIIRYYFHIQSKKYISIKHDYIYLLKSIILTFTAGFISYSITSFIHAMFPVHFIFYIAVAGFFYSILIVLGVRYIGILKEQDLLIIETVEKYTKTNLNILKKLLFRDR